MIKVDNISKIYGKKASLFTALKDISFSIPTGATVAVVGKSGSGKSTLMHIMSGLDHPTSGQILIDGQNIQKLKSKAIDKFRATDMSFVFQQFFIEPNLNTYQNVMLPLEIAEVPYKKRKKMINNALRKVELTDKTDARARDLSGGQKQRLAIARAIVNSPSLIFADEPTGNLDSKTGDIIMDLLFDINKKMGSTLVIVTHDLDLANRCEMQIYLKDGQITKINLPKKTDTK